MSDQATLSNGVTFREPEGWETCTWADEPGGDTCRYYAEVIVERPDLTIGACLVHAREHWLEAVGDG